MASRKKIDVKGGVYNSSGGYKGVRRMGSKYGWEYMDGRTVQRKGGFDSAEEAAYHYDEFLLHYVGPNADTNQALGLLKLKHVLEIREKISKAEKPVTKTSSRHDSIVGKAGFKGVATLNTKKKPYKAQISLNGKYVHIGTFATPEEAARAYDTFVLQHIGAHATTNISLGLLPPIGEVQKAKVKEPDPQPDPQPEPKQEPEVLPEPQPDPEIFIPPYLTPEDEREKQIAAAREMQNDDDEDEVDERPTVQDAESESISFISSGKERVLELPADPAPPAMPQDAQELILLSDADKLRQTAAEFLRRAAEVEAGDIKRQAQERLNTLSATVLKMQNTMMELIDCCADIETQIESLRELISTK